MSLAFSHTTNALMERKAPGFAVAPIRSGRGTGLPGPVLQIDHFRMSAVTFAPHPHAGFSAVSYIFDDSIGSLRNRDSLGNDFTVDAGGLVWTQAGSGIVHDELPVVVGQEVHGLQIFLNLSASYKGAPPAVFRHSAEEFPRVRDASGNEVKLVAGSWRGMTSPLVPAEPIQFIDLLLAGKWHDSLAPDLNAMLYVASGAVMLEAEGKTRQLDEHASIIISGHGEWQVEPCDREARVILISGKRSDEPIVQYGPFVMNSEAQLIEAFKRYESGQMGRLEPLPAH